MEGEFVVKVEVAEEDSFRPLGVVSAIWSELSGGIGPWGAIRPLFDFRGGAARGPLLNRW